MHRYINISFQGKNILKTFLGRGLGSCLYFIPGPILHWKFQYSFAGCHPCTLWLLGGKGRSRSASTPFHILCSDLPIVPQVYWHGLSTNFIWKKIINQNIDREIRVEQGNRVYYILTSCRCGVEKVQVSTLPIPHHAKHSQHQITGCRRSAELPIGTEAKSGAEPWYSYDVDASSIDRQVPVTYTRERRSSKFIECISANVMSYSIVHQSAAVSAFLHPPPPIPLSTYSTRLSSFSICPSSRPVPSRPWYDFMR